MDLNQVAFVLIVLSIFLAISSGYALLRSNKAGKMFKGKNLWKTANYFALLSVALSLCV